jgi:hypothetical protein
MAESLYRDLLKITEEIEALLALEGYDERLTSLLAKRQAVFSRLVEGDLAPEYEVLIRRIRGTEDKCMALAQEKLDKIQGDLLAMDKGKRAMVAYGKHG